MGRGVLTSLWKMLNADITDPLETPTEGRAGQRVTFARRAAG